jgi:hypothetical protein
MEGTVLVGTEGGMEHRVTSLRKGNTLNTPSSSLRACLYERLPATWFVTVDIGCPEAFGEV